MRRSIRPGRPTGQPKFTITDVQFGQYNAVLDGLIYTGHAEHAVEWYVRHPSEVPGWEFNAAAEGVDQYGIDRMYVNWRRVLVRFVSDGEVRDTGHLHRLSVGILNTLGFHHTWLAQDRDNPLLPATAGDDAADEDRVPLFATGVDVAAVAVPNEDPAAELERADLNAALRRGCRMVGRLYVRAAQIYRRCEFEQGKARGAYVLMSQMAVVNDCGQVVGFRPWRATPDAARPEKPVSIQVRAIHQEARRRIRIVAQLLGFNPPPEW